MMQIAPPNWLGCRVEILDQSDVAVHAVFVAGATEQDVLRNLVVTPNFIAGRIRKTCCQTDWSGSCRDQAGRDWGMLFDDGYIQRLDPFTRLQAPYRDELTAVDSSPATGVISTPERDWLIDDGQLIDPIFNAVVGSINKRGIIAWRGGGIDDIHGWPNVEAALSGQAGIPCQLKRSGAVTWYALQHVDTPLPYQRRNERPKAAQLGYRMTYLRGLPLDIAVTIRPLGNSGQTDTPEWMAFIAQKMSASLMTKQMLRFALHDSAAQKNIPLAFRVETARIGIDAEVQIYTDLACWSADPAAVCHEIRPATFAISNSKIYQQWPHEFVHYLGNDDEYQDDGAVGRTCVTNSASIMSDDSGVLQPWHLSNVRQIAERLLQTELQIVPLHAGLPDLLPTPDCLNFFIRP